MVFGLRLRGACASVETSTAWAIDGATVLAAGALAIGSACGPPRLPAPPYARQPTSALAEVPFPPPPARIESVPPAPSKDAVWVDGEWLWQARRYAWKPGRWVRPPPGARFSPWTTVRDARGALFLAAGTWRDPRDADVIEPPPLATGAPGAGPVVSPQGKTLSMDLLAPVDAGSSGPGVQGREAPPNLRGRCPDASGCTMADASPYSSDTSVTP